MGHKQQNGNYLQEDKGGKEGSGQAGKSPSPTRGILYLCPKDTAAGDWEPIGVTEKTGQFKMLCVVGSGK